MYVCVCVCVCVCMYVYNIYMGRLLPLHILELPEKQTTEEIMFIII